MTAPTILLEAAARLGVPVEEIDKAKYTDAGFAIVRHDGVSYIDVPADSPDGEGKTGLMFLQAPKDPYTGSFPVYTPPAEPEPELAQPTSKKAPVAPAATEPASTEGDQPAAPAPADGERHALIERAKELGIKVNGRTKTENIPALIAAAEAEEAGASPIGDVDTTGGAEPGGDEDGSDA